MKYFIYLSVALLVLLGPNTAKAIEQQQQQKHNEIPRETRKAISEQLKSFRAAAELVRTELQNVMATYAAGDDQTKRKRRQAIDELLVRFRKDAEREKEIARLYRRALSGPSSVNCQALSRLKLMVKARNGMENDNDNEKEKDKEKPLKKVNINKYEPELSKSDEKFKGSNYMKELNAQQKGESRTGGKKYEIRFQAKVPIQKDKELHETLTEGPRKNYNKVNILHWVGVGNEGPADTKDNEDGPIDEDLFRKSLQILHSGPSVYEMENRNNLSHEANYKLSKIEQDAAESKKKIYIPFPLSYGYGYGKREAIFNPMSEIKLKTSTRLMRKGFGPSLPSYSLSESRREQMLDNMIKRLENNIEQKNQKMNDDDTPNSWNSRLLPYNTDNLDLYSYSVSNNYERKPQRTTTPDNHYFLPLTSAEAAEQNRLKRKTTKDAPPRAKVQQVPAKAVSTKQLAAPARLAKTVAAAPAAIPKTAVPEALKQGAQMKEIDKLSDGKLKDLRSEPSPQCTAESVGSSKTVAAQQDSYLNGQMDDVFKKRLRRAYVQRKRLSKKNNRFAEQYAAFKKAQTQTVSGRVEGQLASTKIKKRVRRQCALRDVQMTKNKRLRDANQSIRARKKRTAQLLDAEVDNNSDLPRMRRIFLANEQPKSFDKNKAIEPIDLTNLQRTDAADARRPRSNDVPFKQEQFFYNQQMLKKQNNMFTYPSQLDLISQKLIGLKNEQQQTPALYEPNSFKMGTEVEELNTHLGPLDQYQLIPFNGPTGEQSLYENTDLRNNFESHIYDVSDSEEMMTDEKEKRNSCSSESSSLDNLINGKMSAQLVKTIFNHVRNDPELRILWPNLKSNRPITKKEMKSFCLARRRENDSEMQRTEQILRNAMENINEIIQKQKRSSNCVPLRPDLLQFYELILSTYEEMAPYRNKRNHYFNIAKDLSDELHDSGNNKLTEKSHIIKKLLQQFKELSAEDQAQVSEIRDDLLKDLENLRSLEKDDKRRKRHNQKESAKLLAIGIDNKELARLEKEQGLTSQYLKLIKTTEAMRDAAIQPE